MEVLLRSPLEPGLYNVPFHPWVGNLIQFDTTSRNSNLGLIETVRDFLAGYGADITLTGDRTGKKANLFATFRAANGSKQGGVILSGHTDVVPVDGQKWTSDPFIPVIRDGKLFGRGTCDMKGFIGTVLGAVPLMADRRLERPIHIALSYDEEVGCLGVRSLLKDIVAREVKAESCVVGEPTNMRVVSAHKGRSAYRCCVRGKAAHSSLVPYGVNAIEYAAEVIVFIKALMQRRKLSECPEKSFLVPFSTGLTTTMEGGNSMNTIPYECRFTFEFRNLPGMDSQELFDEVKRFAEIELETEMRQTCDAAAITFEQLSNTPALAGREDDEFLQLVLALSREKVVEKVAYTTEAGLFQSAGIRTLVCGPGDIQQAHKADEFVTLAQLTQCDKFIKDMIESFSTQSAR